MVTAREIQRVVDDIVRLFAPRQIILFGSYARGSQAKDSEVDLMIVIPYRGRSDRKATEISSAVRIDFPCDILVRTPAQLRQRLRMKDCFIQDVLGTGKVLYESGD